MSNADRKKPGKKNRASRKRRLIERHGPRCVRCRGLFGFDDLTLDHITPQSRGGDWSIGNLQLMCQPCNAAKGAT